MYEEYDILIIDDKYSNRGSLMLCIQSKVSLLEKVREG